MKKLIYILSFLPILTFSQTKDITDLRDPYLGQKPPGKTPEIFAPGIISLEGSAEYRCLVWDNGKKLLLVRRNSGCFETEIKNNKWTAFKQTTIFSGHDHTLENISPNGKKITFNRSLTNPNVRGVREIQIWMVEKDGANWKAPYYTGINGMYPYCDKDDNLYYTTVKDGHNCIGISYFQNSKYSETAVVPATLCSSKYFTHPCADPDGNWIIFNTEGNNYTENGSRMFISFKKTDSEWTEAISMGSYLKGNMIINISTDGKYLFYTRKGDIYWVSAKIIEDLKPENLK